MSYARQMLDTYPRDFNLDAGVCTATLRVASRQTEYDANVTGPLLRVCGGLPELRAGLPGAARSDAVVQGRQPDELGLSTPRGIRR